MKQINIYLILYINLFCFLRGVAYLLVYSFLPQRLTKTQVCLWAILPLSRSGFVHAGCTLGGTPSLLAAPCHDFWPSKYCSRIRRQTHKPVRVIDSLVQHVRSVSAWRALTSFTRNSIPSNVLDTVRSCISGLAGNRLLNSLFI